MYQDLRGFISAVDALGALRRIDGADPHHEIGGITEVAAGLSPAPALLFDRDQGISRRPPHLLQCGDDAAARRARARHRSEAHPARRAQGVDGEAQGAHAARARRSREGGVARKLHARRRRRARQAPCPGLACRRRRRLYRLRQHRRHARPRYGLDQRLDLSRPGPRPRPGDGPVRPSRPPRRHHREEIPRPRRALPGRRRQRRRPGAVRRRLRVPARRRLGIRLRRRLEGRADRDLRRRRSPACRCRRRPRSFSKATCRPPATRCRKGRSASSPAITPTTRGRAR